MEENHRNGTLDRKKFGRLGMAIRRDGTSDDTAKHARECAKELGKFLVRGKLADGIDPPLVRVFQKGMQRAHGLPGEPGPAVTTEHLIGMKDTLSDWAKAQQIDYPKVMRFADYLASTKPEFLARSK